LRLRLAILGVSLASIGFAVAAACGFPDPALLVAEDDGGGDDASNDANRAETASPQEAGKDAIADTDAADSGADAIVDSGPSGADAEAACPKPCDCDDDGYLSTSCGGNDCDDHDPRTHPEAGFVSDPPDGSGDWDCDGVVVKNAKTNVSCVGAIPCDASGFSGNPGCGQSASFVRCGFVAVSICENIAPSTKVMGCK
jgi:hypothetical protein